MIVGNSFHGLMHKIGRYQVELELGRGAMGIVYRAFDPAIGRRIAIKTIRLDELGDEQSRTLLKDRLLREAQSAGILSHPNIVTIYDISEDDANAYIFMEYVEGATLDSFARGLPTEDLIYILEQTAAALDYAHERGIIHRDIKPGNLMLSGKQVKITDFGIARLQHRDSTQTGTLLGTPSYMSPEQVAGSEVSGATDQYALGVIAFEFLAGYKPFETDNLANLLYRITQHPVPPVARLNAATNQVLARVLAKSPAHRYPTCTAFVVALEQALGIEAPRHTPQREVSGDEPTILAQAPPALPPENTPVLPPLNLPQQPQPSSPWKAILGSFLAASLLIGVLWWALRPTPATPVAPVAPPTATAETTQLKPSAAGEKVDPPVTPPVVEPSTPKTTTPPAELRQPDAEPQTVAFSSSPEGAEILINQGQQDRCPKTPCSLELPAGDFQVTAKLPGFEDLQRNLHIPGTTRLQFDFEKPSGTIMVNSNPSGAIVRINGRDSGQKTPAMLKLAPGKYTVEVVKEGLEPQIQDVTVRNGVIQTLAIQWN
jgi:serine/threonine protein kinase